MVSPSFLALRPQDTVCSTVVTQVGYITVRMAQSSWCLWLIYPTGCLAGAWTGWATSRTACCSSSGRYRRCSGCGWPVDGDVVVKAREDDGRAASCVAAQTWLAERGFPCARPLTPAVGVGALAVHAEESRPGGELLPGDTPDVAQRYAAVFARLMAELADLQIAPPLPNPRWVRWDHKDSGLWPSIRSVDERDQTAVPAYVMDTAERARERLLAADLPCALGHADFEAQNLRWHDNEVWAVHDWDSLAWQPEAALVGAASGVFPKTGPATLPPIESSEAFLVAYQDLRGRRF